MAARLWRVALENARRPQDDLGVSWHPCCAVAGMTENLAHWNRFADIDPKFTKPITGKAYRGTSPNPQYVIRCLTEIFGPVGVGFGWDVVAEDFTPLGDEVLHWCRIRFWHSDRANAFDSYGQTKALMKTKNGMMLDEDAPKKSLTDAIIKAASHVGIAANIFLGRWDDQKYVADVNAEYRASEAPKPYTPGPRQAKAEAAPEVPTEEAIEHAKQYVSGADTVDDITARWQALPQPVRNHKDVIASAAARKAELQTPPADDLGGDTLPY